MRQETIAMQTQAVAPAASGDPIRELTDDDVAAFARDHPFAVIETYAQWCSFCRALEPHVRDLARELGDDVAFGRIDADFNPVYVAQHRVLSLPTLHVYRNGALAGTIVGFLPPAKLRAAVLRLMRDA